MTATTDNQCQCDCHYADSGHLICSRCLRNHRIENRADENICRCNCGCEKDAETKDGRGTPLCLPCYRNC